MLIMHIRICGSAFLSAAVVEAAAGVVDVRYSYSSGIVVVQQRIELSFLFPQPLKVTGFLV